MFRIYCSVIWEIVFGMSIRACSENGLWRSRWGWHRFILLFQLLNLEVIQVWLEFRRLFHQRSVKVWQREGEFVHVHTVSIFFPHGLLHYLSHICIFRTVRVSSSSRDSEEFRILLFCFWTNFLSISSEHTLLFLCIGRHWREDSVLFSLSQNRFDNFFSFEKSCWWRFVQVIFSCSLNRFPSSLKIDVFQKTHYSYQSDCYF